MGMETTYWLDKFTIISEQLAPALLNESSPECRAGVWLKSPVLKMQKRSWLNRSKTAKPFEESIFFSVWLNDESINANKLYYNIHALKLRQLTDYSIKSREFAEAFRYRFKPFEKKWPNVSVDFGPLTLMQGWVPINTENFEHEVIKLAHQFLEIYFIIDDLLEERKKGI